MSEMSEPEFLNRLYREKRCGVLLTCTISMSRNETARCARPTISRQSIPPRCRRSTSLAGMSWRDLYGFARGNDAAGGVELGLFGRSGI